MCAPRNLPHGARNAALPPSEPKRNSLLRSTPEKEGQNQTGVTRARARARRSVSKSNHTITSFLDIFLSYCKALRCLYQVIHCQTNWNCTMTHALISFTYVPCLSFLPYFTDIVYQVIGPVHSTFQVGGRILFTQIGIVLLFNFYLYISCFKHRLRT